MGRLAAAKLQSQQEQKPKRQTEAPKYPGFAETGIDQKTWESQQPEFDDRSGASKVFDALNPADSGRSFTTKTPSKDASKKSTGTQLKDDLKNVGESIASPFKRLGAGGAEVVNEVTGNADKEAAAYSKTQDDLLAQYKDAVKKSKAEADPEKKKKLDKVVSTIEKNMKSTFQDRDKRLKEVQDRTDPTKAAAAIGEVVLDASTLGTGGAAVQAGKVAGKEAVEQGGRLAAKKIAETAASTGAQGAGSGALSAVEQKGKGTNLHDVATGALTGFVGGAALGGASAGAGQILRRGLKTKGGAVEEPAPAATEAPAPADNLDTPAFMRQGDATPAEQAQSAFVGDSETPAFQRRVAPEAAGTPAERVTQSLASVEGNNPELVAPIKIEKGVRTVDPAEVQPPTDASLAQTVRAPRTANADVETPGVTVAQPVKLKILADVEDEGRARGGSQPEQTQTTKGAEYLVDDIDKLQKQTGVDVESLDKQVAQKLSGETRRTNFQEFRDKMGRHFQDTLTYATRTLGKTGTEFVHDMLAGNKFKRDSLEVLRQPMSDLAKLNKKLSGKSLTSRRDLGARIGSALDDRENADQFLKTPEERKLFDSYVQVFDYVKNLREKAGLEVLENYRPWVSMKDASEPPTWLAENITSKKTQTLSRYSKERTKTSAGDDVDNNLADMIYGYVNSQLNELAYDAPVKKLKGNIDNLSAGNKANVGAMNEGIDYLRTMTEQAVNPARKNPLERGAAKLTSNIYGSVLPLNIRLAVQNKAQKFVANSRVSKGARSMATKIDEADATELEKGMVFGDTTVYGQLEDVNPTGVKKTTAGEKLKKVDPYQKSEHNNVITSYRKGAMQAVMESDAYKAAKASGQKTNEAIHTALQDPEVMKLAQQRGNVVVNDTQFGASPLSRPEMLREEGSIWGVIPKKSIYMFTRFPIGMSQHTLEVLDNKSARALEVLKNGDPRAVPIAEMRTSYHALLSSMKDAQAAAKQGTDVGIPPDVLKEQISVITKNIGIIDKELKNKSQIRGGKTVKNLAKMWAAAAAIQIIFDGGIQSFADDPVGTSADAIGKTNPTLGNRVVGQYSPLASISSSASPLDRRGGVNERALANYVPGVGLAVNRGRDIKKLAESLLGSGN